MNRAPSTISYGAQQQHQQIQQQPSQQLCATCAACPTCGPNRGVPYQGYVQDLQQRQNAEMIQYQQQQERMRKMYEQQENGIRS